MMRAVQDGKLPQESLLAQSSECLGCRACEPVCPAGVEYGVLIEEARDILWQGKNRPLIIRGLFLLAGTKWGIWALGLFAPIAKNRVSDPKINLMLGCFERRLFPDVSKKVAKIAPEISICKSQNCCGALHAHNGELELGKAMAKTFGDQLPGTIVTTAGGCAAHLSSVLGRDRVKEFSEYWGDRSASNSKIKVEGHIVRVGLQDSCHLKNGMGVTEQPREILKSIADYVEIPNAGGCCGAAGSYALLEKKNSQKVVSQKVKDIAALNLDFVITVNPGCTRQLATELKRAKVKTKVIHLAQLIAMA